MTQTNFLLDPQLESSSIWVHDHSLCQVRLKNDRRFPWIILIPRRPEIVEIFDLATVDQKLLWVEVGKWAKHMHDLFQAYKMNIEILGNKVRQCHIHIIVRYATDAAWPNSILNYGKCEPYFPEEITKRVQEIAL